MGVKDLHRDFINRPKHEKKNKKPQHHLKELDGPVGVDISTILYRCVCSTLGSAVADVDSPKVPLYHAYQEVVNVLQLLTEKHGLDIVLVFDNKSHPMKEATQTERRADRRYHLEELQRLYRCSDVNDAVIESVTDHRKKLASPRPDLIAMIMKYCRDKDIKFCSAPFEADWQLVALQKDNVIKHIMSSDGDLFVLGGDSIVTEVNFSEGTCCIYDRSKILQRKSMGSGMLGAHDLPTLACLSGNDYINRLHGNGHKTVIRLLSHYTSLSTTEAKEDFILKLEQKSKWKKGDKPPAAGFSDLFWKVHNLQVYAPAFRLDRNNPEDPIDLLDPASYRICLGSLNPLPPNTTDEEWAKMIGFDKAPSAFFSSEAGSVFQMKSWGDMEVEPQELEQPKLRIEPFYDVPHGAYLDESIPTNLQSRWSLTAFLSSRKLAPRGKYKHNSFVRIAEKCLGMMKRDPGRAPQPVKFEPSQQNASYCDEENLMPRDGSQVVWSSDWDDIVSALVSVQRMDDADFESVFGSGCTGIQARAKRLILSGHFDLSKIQVARVALKSTGKDAIAIRIQSVPSMKSEPYWVTGVFDEETGKFLVPPTSRCACPAGNNGCSHSQAEYAMLSFVKETIESSLEFDDELVQQDEIVSMFPPALSTMKGLPIPWQYAFSDSEAELELKRLKRVACNDARKSRQNLAAIFERVAYESGYDSVNDLDYDSEYDPESSSISGPEIEEDDFDLDHSSSDSDVEEEILERFMPEEVDNQPTASGLCSFVRDMIADSSKYAEVSGSGETNEYKLEQRKIRTTLQELLDGIGGPDGSVADKLFQLKLHSSLHSGYTNNELHRCLLSFYLEKTKAQREVHLSQLEAAKTAGLTKTDLNWTAQRLEKCPVSMWVLADRGFADCSLFYPNLNPIITPSFLEGRAQFTTEESNGDRTKCESRYSSEAFFKRVWDSEVVNDKIPRHRFQYLVDALKWSMAMANCKQPYMIPRGHKSYFNSNTIYKTRVSRTIVQELQSETTEPMDIDTDVVFHNNFILDAMPEEYFQRGLEKVGLLNDGKDFVTDTIRINSCLSRSQYSDKMHSSAGRYIAWTLPCGLSATYSPLFLGRISEKAIVEYWGGGTSEFMTLQDDN